MIFHDNENKILMTITSLFIQSLFQIMPNANIIVPYSLLNQNNKNTCSFIDIFCLPFFKCLFKNTIIPYIILLNSSLLISFTFNPGTPLKSFSPLNFFFQS